VQVKGFFFFPNRLFFLFFVQALAVISFFRVVLTNTVLKSLGQVMVDSKYTVCLRLTLARMKSSKRKGDLYREMSAKTRSTSLRPSRSSFFSSPFTRSWVSTCLWIRSGPCRHWEELDTCKTFSSAILTRSNSRTSRSTTWYVKARKG